jgi:hypothetical protein
MPTADVNIQQTENEDRFSVGWQKLTREEFLEAISAAVLDKVRRLELQQGEKSGHFPHTQTESAD